MSVLCTPFPEGARPGDRYPRRLSGRPAVAAQGSRHRPLISRKGRNGAIASRRLELPAKRTGASAGDGKHVGCDFKLENYDDRKPANSLVSRTWAVVLAPSQIQEIPKFGAS